MRRRRHELKLHPLYIYIYINININININNSNNAMEDPRRFFVCLLVKKNKSADQFVIGRADLILFVIVVVITTVIYS